jgi:molybdate transport system substrate-binding protein
MMVAWVLIALALLSVAGVMIYRLLRRYDGSKSVISADGLTSGQLKRGRSESRVMLAIVLAFPASIAAMVLLLVATFMFRASDVDPSQRSAIVTVFASASTSDVINELAAIYREESNIIVQCNFASSSALAKQLQAGAKADVFLSASEKWMDEVEAGGEVDPATRVNLLGNRLVLIAAADNDVAIDLAEAGSIAAALKGRLALGDPDHVPAGIYAKEALINLQQWTPLERRVAPGADVRVALRYVATGTADLGIVYATDAKVEPAVRIVATLPASSHEQVRYPVAVCSDASPDAQAFVRFLQSERAKRLFERAGFEFLPATVAAEASR